MSHGQNYRQVDAERARREAIEKNRQGRKLGEPNFNPHDGYCHYCDTDLVLYFGTQKWAGGLSLTGCPKCHRSYCD